jgi:hypothetical protein
MNEDEQPKPAAGESAARPQQVTTDQENPGPGNPADGAAPREGDAKLIKIINVFNEKVNAPNSRFGADSGLAETGAQRRARTGRIADAETIALCAHFAEPGCYADAARALGQHQVVVLAGASGIGKRTSAIHLLQGAGAGPLEVVSPTLTLVDLAEHNFEAGRGYLVEDWQPASRNDDAGDYPWRVLGDHVRDSKAHLVLTTNAVKTSRPQVLFAWQAPSAERVLAAHLTGTDAEAQARRVAERIPKTYGIGQVAVVGRRLAAGEDEAKLLEELSRDPARHVREWLSPDTRSDREILEVLTLGFAAGQSQRVFEEMYDRLENSLRHAGIRPKPDKDGAKAGSPRPGLVDTLTREWPPDGLIGQSTVTEGRGSTEIVSFREAAYHRLALEQLWRLYQMRFWNAVRDWLADLVKETAVTVIDDATETRIWNDAVQVSVAAGLAELAHLALEEVEGSYLHPWAAGELDWPGQQAAVYVLWHMAKDDSLAPIALGIATSWINSGHADAQWTGAAALSGELGAGYPVEATRRLWHLVGQAKEAGLHIGAMASLFTTLLRGGEGRDAVQVLTLLRDRLKKASAPKAGAGKQSTSSREDQRTRELVMLTILEVLAIRDPKVGKPAITVFLNSQPEHRALVAELWAVVLRNRPYRLSALVALLNAVKGFGQLGGDPEAAARALGDALGDALPPAEHQPLKTDFIGVNARSKRSAREVAAAVQALLDALGQLKPKETATQ